ncbi:carbohydrate kinase [Mucilaginibacter sp. JRF]|uniref:FGGY-family carbohydrate kinase n=1 Tax=Mucilaginibacter sp. JRF TaxID=2780088 RepID=UPI0018805D00|nr:FGGY family carbohydrate kinase [Mucilaginibacter sp. JRF]MBE9583776.1 carbohydrate kinase [Mucilaginibacter sp. JRF]
MIKQPQPVIAIFDIGKTNKKLFLFDDDYKIVHERCVKFDEITDEDGMPCEDLARLRQWVTISLQDALSLPDFEIKAVNFATYGASLVYIDEQGAPLTQLYNYLKPFPDELKERFYSTYGDEDQLAEQTASPALGSLNSGFQLYRFKHEQPELFERMQYALHLPQYMSYLLTAKPATDMTSIGCHTALWNFADDQYHDWIYAEGLEDKLAPILPGDKIFDTTFHDHNIKTGIGLHDSSSALIPYLVSFNEPFVLLSTGTWNICLNPFDHTPLTAEALHNDCLNYIQYEGLPVKASRLFAGHECEVQTQRIAKHFGQSADKYQNIAFDTDLVNQLNKKVPVEADQNGNVNPIAFNDRDLEQFANDIEAYHQLLIDIMQQQTASIKWVMNGAPVKHIFVDGGFSKNRVFMQLMSMAYPDIKVCAASVAQATALGAALSIHQHWNSKPQPNGLIAIKQYSVIADDAIKMTT